METKPNWRETSLNIASVRILLVKLVRKKIAEPKLENLPSSIAVKEVPVGVKDEAVKEAN